MEPLQCVVFGCVIAVGGPNFAEQQFHLDNSSAPESAADVPSTEKQRTTYDALPDSSNPYAPLWKQRGLYDARTGSSGASSETGGVILYSDSPGNQGIIREYGGGMKGYQFDRPPSTFPDERR
jgi:hypothetical protein